MPDSFLALMMQSFPTGPGDGLQKRLLLDAARKSGEADPLSVF